MTRILYTLLILATFLVNAGCSHSSSPSITTSILSDSSVDGDIEQLATNSYVITQGMSISSGVQSVFAGVDPDTTNETRAFLDFPLGGSDGVPVDAIIDSATLELYIDSLNTNSIMVPIRIELVSFDQSTLIATDYDRVIQPPLAYITIQPPISSDDVGTSITLDVTSLVEEAQARSLPDFQVRILEDFGTSVAGIIEIDDSTGIDRKSFGPLLTVTYH